MNKKLFIGAAALTTVAIGGYVYYRWVTSQVDRLTEDEIAGILAVEEEDMREDPTDG